MVVHDYAAIAIQDFSAGRKHGDGLDAVLHGAFLIEFRIPDLQVPDPCQQEQEDADHHVLEKRDLTGRELGTVAQYSVLGNVLVYAIGVKVQRYFNRLLRARLNIARPSTPSRSCRYL